MGMDVSGKNGNYFHANCWHWRPLWDYCYEVAPHIIDDKTYQACHYNDGKGLDAFKANKLGMLLLNLLASGDVEKYKVKRENNISKLPDRECLACSGVGTIVSLMQDNNAYDTQLNVCKSCKGIGRKDNWENSYVFNTKTVEEWAEFLIDCGGFEVS